jgi:hypothetical protein
MAAHPFRLQGKAGKGDKRNSRRTALLAVCRVFLFGASPLLLSWGVTRLEGQYPQEKNFMREKPVKSGVYGFAAKKVYAAARQVTLPLRALRRVGKTPIYRDFFDTAIFKG